MKKKKINGLSIELEKKRKLYLVKNRYGDTVESTNNITSAINFAEKDRRYVEYKPSIGGLLSKTKSKDSTKHLNRKKKKNRED